MKVKTSDQGQVSPGIMHSCRKAPIMTIGINPNLTAYYPSQSGAVWAYPNFSKDMRYSYYYRITITQQLKKEVQTNILMKTQMGINNQ